MIARGLSRRLLQVTTTPVSASPFLTSPLYRPFSSKLHKLQNQQKKHKSDHKKPGKPSDLAAEPQKKAGLTRSFKDIVNQTILDKQVALAKFYQDTDINIKGLVGNMISIGFASMGWSMIAFDPLGHNLSMIYLSGLPLIAQASQHLFIAMQEFELTDPDKVNQSGTIQTRTLVVAGMFLAYIFSPAIFTSSGCLLFYSSLSLVNFFFTSTSVTSKRFWARSHLMNAFLCLMVIAGLVVTSGKLKPSRLKKPTPPSPSTGNTDNQGNTVQGEIQNVVTRDRVEAAVNLFNKGMEGEQEVKALYPNSKLSPVGVAAYRNSDPASIPVTTMVIPKSAIQANSTTN